MDLSCSASAPQDLDVDLLAIVVDDPTRLPAAAAELDGQLGGALTRELQRGQVKADAASIVVVTGGATGPGRIALVGYGPEEDGRGDALRVAGSKVAGAARGAEARSVAMVTGTDVDDVDALVTGFVLGAFRIHKYQSPATTTGDVDTDAEASSSKYDGPESFVVAAPDDAVGEAARAAFAIAEAQNWARDLANAPANRMMPVDLADRARELAEAHEHLSFRELGRSEIEAAGMGMFAAVAQGSADDPRLIVLEWNPPGADGADDARLALVGKAVVFDTGGISIKPSGGMEDMKLDKSGGCAVLGAMRAIAATSVPRRVIAVVGATTNMPDGNAYRPGDVVTAMDGTTVEIISTDAEGRLVLGDCITYVKGQGCGAIVEASTLTGAMVIALGHRYTGAIAKKGPLVDAVVAAGERTGDHAWHLPMHDEYKANLKTACADFKNSGSRDAGALSAGSFLGHFAKDVPFVHLDVAGTAMLSKPRMWYGTKGASGWGVRLMTDLAASWGS
ncbi:MAG: leucyl aminopeptidase [Thermoleophilia bacterium]|nr:leucyl aminopeptidase [Thermoleophilia bacterium]